MNTNTNRGVLWGAVALGTTVSVLGQLSVNFESSAPGGAEDNQSLISSFTLSIPAGGQEITLSATYDGSMSVQNSSGYQWASYTVSLEKVQLTLSGDRIEIPGKPPGTPLVLELGPLTGRAENVPLNGSQPVVFSPLVTSGAASAMLAGLSSGTGNYELRWWVSAIGVQGDSGKQGQVVNIVHHVAGQVAVPEPSTYALVAGLGLVAFALWRRRP